jgi:hypothetical protein
MQSGVVRMTAAPLCMARQKRVSQMKYFRNKFIFKICFKFRFVLSKLPASGSDKGAPGFGLDGNIRAKPFRIALLYSSFPVPHFFPVC